MSQFGSETEKSAAETGSPLGSGSIMSGNVSGNIFVNTAPNSRGLPNHDMNGVGSFGSQLESKIGTETVSFTSKLGPLGSSNASVGRALFGSTISKINCDETRGIFGSAMDNTSGNEFLANSSASPASGLFGANTAKNNKGIFGNSETPVGSNISGTSTTSN